MESGRTLEWEGYEYDGPVELAGGGPSDSQKDAAAATAANTQAQTQLAQEANQRQTAAYNSIAPFATTLMTKGDPSYGAQSDYAGGNAAVAAAPARAALARQLSSIGSLPSGFKTGALTNLNEQEAQGYDQNLQAAQQNQLNTKLQGANIINGLQTTYNPNTDYSSANTGNNSIMQAPLQQPGWQGVVGGITGGLASGIGKGIGAGTLAF